ncbi:MAG: two component sensor [Beijerinckiaceae bacterium]|nr:MAG: two component sensor [Beijerinckiaceae bacterium]
MSASKLRILFLAGLVALFPAVAVAKSYTIPDPNPVAVVTIPDDWETTVIPKGIEVESEDEEIYIAIEVIEVAKVDKAIEEAINWLKSKDVVVDAATQKQADITINGIPGFEVQWTGKDADGPTNVSLTLLVTSESKGLMVTYWASPEGEKDNMKALKGIIESLKSVK